MQSFNGGSQLTIAGKGDSDAVARATVNTILGACGAGLTVLILIKFVGAPPGKWSYLATLNGALTGMVQRTPKKIIYGCLISSTTQKVSMCGGCNQYEPWAAILIGIFGGFAYTACHKAMLK